MRNSRPFHGALVSAACLVAALFAAGCTSSRQDSPLRERSFEFHKDTFAYANELVWEYAFNEDGKWVGRRREPTPDHTHHCFVLVRSARQFFQHARFDPALPKADDATCRSLIRQVVSRSPRSIQPSDERVVIPGYSNLHEFSREKEALLKESCGGAWQSYFQRGHWRMIFPISRAHQEKTAEALTQALRLNRPPVVHIVQFPSLTINHAVLVFGVAETETELRFDAYDPNRPEQPVTLTYHRSERTFTFPQTDYFPGGSVDAYEIFSGWLY